MSHPRSILLQTGALVALVGGGALLALCYRPAAALAQDAPTTSRMSVGTDGTQATGESAYPAISGDGRYVAFASSASNLVAGDSNEAGDVFVKDCTNGALVCASLSTSGTPAAGESYAPSISADGQRVVFVSEGADLVANDGNQMADVFMRDFVAQATTRVSLSQGGEEADGSSSAARLSADGRFVAFVSQATNLVAGDTNGESDVFVRDLQTGALERISVAAAGEPADGGSEGPALSGDGRYVAFASTASNLIPGENGAGATKVWDVYRRDRASGTTMRVSASLTGGKGDGHSFAPAISADGRYVAFASYARNLITSDLDGRPDVYVRDLQAGTTQRVSVGLGGLEPTGDSLRPSISSDGRFVTFESGAGNLVSEPRPEGSTWTYVRDLLSELTARVVAASADSAPECGTVNAAISGDGRWIAFSSAEPALVAGDSNALEDVFVRGPLH
jgi:Tol biopolymer transport system component